MTSRALKIIGHRGAAGLAPENTMASLRKSLEHHADMLEFDLRVTRDSVVVLHHDPEIIDAGANKLKISECTYKELRTHKPDLATFDDVLREFGSKIPLVVEIKPDEPTGPIIAIIKQTKGVDLSLASFSQKILLELQEALPDIPKIVIEKWSGVRAGRRMRQLGTKQVFMNQKWLWWGFVRSVSRGGWELYPYTLNEPAKARRWATWGLAGVITDYPDRFEK
jgi:glycerophosphoryl diester phosphodiesterase